MGANVLLAIQALGDLLAVMTQAATAAQQIQSVIGTAQAAGTDITDAQLQQAISARDAAMAQLQQTLGVSTAAPAPAAPATPAAGS